MEKRGRAGLEDSKRITCKITSIETALLHHSYSILFSTKRITYKITSIETSNNAIFKTEKPTKRITCKITSIETLI